MKPILFNTENVRALLEGRKTATRRAVKFKGGQNPAWSGYIPDGAVLYGSNNIPAAKAPYQPGDILWVRETFQNIRIKHPGRAVPDDYQEIQYEYKADGDIRNSDGTPIKWRSPYHMPQEAARIFLRVTDVQVERLNDITEAQAKAEGASIPLPAQKDPEYEEYIGGYWVAFADLWDSTIKPADRPTYGWDANPWVWVIEFERISKEEAEGK